MTNIQSLNNNIIKELVRYEFFFEKLDKKDFVRWLIQEILEKKEKKGSDILDVWSRTLCT